MSLTGIHNSASASGPFDFQAWWDSQPDDTFVQVRKRDVTDKLAALMRSVGQSGSHVFVRYDPVRDDKNFTVMIDSTRVGDGNDPAEIIRQYLRTS